MREIICCLYMSGGLREGMWYDFRASRMDKVASTEGH